MTLVNHLLYTTSLARIGYSLFIQKRLKAFKSENLNCLVALFKKALSCHKNATNYISTINIRGINDTE